MIPYEVNYKYNAITATTTILVNNKYYDEIEDYVRAEEKPHLTYTILQQLYAADAQKEVSKLRRENQHLKTIISVYEQMENINK